MNSAERRRKFELLRIQAKNKRSPMMTIWQTIADNFFPEGMKINDTPSSSVNRMDPIGSRIIDNEGGDSLGNFVAGLFSNMTNPARPWFRFQPDNPEVVDSQAVKVWCDDTRTRIANVLLKSNAYQVLPVLYEDMGWAGTSCAFVDEDDADVIRLYALPVGSYCIATTAQGRVNTLIREYSMTVGNMVQEFGEENVSQEVRDMYRAGTTEADRDVVQIICPNAQWDGRKLASKYKKFESVHYEMGNGSTSEGGDPVYLRESGYDEFPGLGCRWKTRGTNVYGMGPAFSAIGDVMQLQQLHRRKLQALDKTVNPPVQVPASLMNTQINMLPGGVNVVEGNGQAITPLYNINFNTAGVLEDINACHDRIRRKFYADLWLLISSIERTGVTATEIQAKQDEKLQQLGTAVDRIVDELLTPLLERVFAIMLRRGLLADPPEELRGVDLKIDYVSTIAQALKMASSAGIGRFLGIVGNISQSQPQVADKVDYDKTLDLLADDLAIPPSMLRSTEEAMQIRAVRQKAQQDAQQAANFQQVAKGAELLSKTPTNTDSLLSRSLGTA